MDVLKLMYHDRPEALTHSRWLRVAASSGSADDSDGSGSGSGSGSDGSEVCRLMKMFMLADQFQMPIRCVKHIVSDLTASIGEYGLCAEDVEMWYGGMSNLWDHPHLSHLHGLFDDDLIKLLSKELDKGKGKGKGGCDEDSALKLKLMLTAFCNVPKVACSERLVRLFVKAPLDAVLLWAESDLLVVHSENCVVYMLDRWACENKPSPKDADSMCLKVRMAHLSPTYLTYVLPSLGWSGPMQSGAKILTLYRLLHEPAQPAYELWALKDLEKAWTRPPRMSMSVSASSDDIKASTEWTVPARQLRLLASSGMSFSILSPSFYVNGVMFCIAAHLKPAITSGHTCMTFGISLRILQPRSALVYSIKANITCGSDIRGTAITRNICTFARSSQVGFSDFAKRSAATLDEIIAPFIDAEGGLRIVATDVSFA